MLQVTSHLLRDIKEGQHLDENLARIKERLEDPKYKSFHLDQYKTLWFGKKLVVPNQEKLKRQILNEAHESLFSIHPGSNKMYQDVRKSFLWKGLKQDIARFVAECDVCCRVKAEHLKPAGTLQPLPILAWKWEDITMDFIIGLPRTSSGHDSIWVIVYRLTKSAHFIPVRINYAVSKLAELYLTKIVVYMVFRRLSCQIESHNLLLSYGKNCARQWKPLCYLAQLITRKLQAKPRESIRS